ncbi:MAG: hypothetical protein LKM39_11465 [Chiayiivirga sp.]|jgi:hypothetical protein|nr:hypothetical protein [Chiayiivirga sp.]
MLPNTFEWRRWPVGRGLFLDGHLVAKILLFNAPEAVVELHPDLLKSRRLRFGSEAEALRYVEAWAVKWEHELHAAYVRRISVRTTAGREARRHD